MDFPDPSTRKTFIPLENNPTVMATLAHNLGLSPTLNFVDVYSFTDPDLLSLIPRPVHALLVLIPMTPAWKRSREIEDASLKPWDSYDGKTGPDGEREEEKVFWIKQTINHSCGLVGLVHCVLNLHHRQKSLSSLSSSKTTNTDNTPPQNNIETNTDRFIMPDSILDRFIREARKLSPVPRAQLLYDSQEFESAHRAAAVQGDTAPPPMDEEDSWGHFIAFVRGSDGHLWELEGGRKGGVDRGVLKDGEDLLSERALKMGVGGLMRKAGGEGDEVRCCCLALVETNAKGD